MFLNTWIIMYDQCSQSVSVLINYHPFRSSNDQSILRIIWHNTKKYYTQTIVIQYNTFQLNEYMSDFPDILFYVCTFWTFIAYCIMFSAKSDDITKPHGLLALITLF